MENILNLVLTSHGTVTRLRSRQFIFPLIGTADSLSSLNHSCDLGPTAATSNTNRYMIFRAQDSELTG